MNHVLATILVVVLVLATSVWCGGLVAIAVVARSASTTLDPAQRVAFFRALGRSYLKVGTGALVLALVAGAALLSGHAWDGTVLAALVLTLCLFAALGAGVVQARQMTRLRRRAVGAPDDASLTEEVRRGARSATALRGLIGLFTLALVVLGAVLAT